MISSILGIDSPQNEVQRSFSSPLGSNKRISALAVSILSGFGAVATIVLIAIGIANPYLLADIAREYTSIRDSEDRINGQFFDTAFKSVKPGDHYDNLMDLWIQDAINVFINDKAEVENPSDFQSYFDQIFPRGSFNRTQIIQKFKNKYPHNCLALKIGSINTNYGT